MRRRKLCYSRVFIIFLELSKINLVRAKTQIGNQSRNPAINKARLGYIIQWIGSSKALTNFVIWFTFELSVKLGKFPQLIAAEFSALYNDAKIFFRLIFGTTHVKYMFTEASHVYSSYSVSFIQKNEIHFRQNIHRKCKF